MKSDASVKRREVETPQLSTRIWFLEVVDIGAIRAELVMVGLSWWEGSVHKDKHTTAGPEQSYNGP
jgi:hypothetical protein